MRRFPVTALFAVILAAFGMGCGSSDTKDIETDDIHLTVRVVSPDNEMVNVTASLDNGLFLQYTLANGDKLHLLNGDTKKKLSSDGFLFPTYKATIPLEPPNDYVITLTRKRYEDAPDSNVSLPFAFEIFEPEEEAFFSDSDSVSIRWTPYETEDQFYIYVENKCKHEDGHSSEYEFFAGDDPEQSGFLEITMDDILEYTRETEEAFNSVEDLEYSEIVDCEIKIRLEHVRKGKIDPVLGGGFINGIQKRNVIILYEAEPPA